MRPFTFDDYLDIARQIQSEERDWRWGQTLFNVLYRYRQDLSEQVRGTELDPFHRSDATDFLEWVQKNW